MPLGRHTDHRPADLGQYKGLGTYIGMHCDPHKYCLVCVLHYDTHRVCIAVVDRSSCKMHKTWLAWNI